jgi:hypothetical protein
VLRRRNGRVGLCPEKRISPIFFPLVLRPASRSRSVVLPEPEGPISTDSCCGSKQPVTSDSSHSFFRPLRTENDRLCGWCWLFVAFDCVHQNKCSTVQTVRCLRPSSTATTATAPPKTHLEDHVHPAAAVLAERRVPLLARAPRLVLPPPLDAAAGRLERVLLLGAAARGLRRVQVARRVAAVAGADVFRLGLDVLELLWLVIEIVVVQLLVGRVPVGLADAQRKGVVMEVVQAVAVAVAVAVLLLVVLVVLLLVVLLLVVLLLVVLLVGGAAAAGPAVPPRPRRRVERRRRRPVAAAAGVSIIVSMTHY